MGLIDGLSGRGIKQDTPSHANLKKTKTKNDMKPKIGGQLGQFCPKSSERAPRDLSKNLSYCTSSSVYNRAHL
jgi:hypothetical protein